MILKRVCVCACVCVRVLHYEAHVMVTHHRNIVDTKILKLIPNNKSLAYATLTHQDLPMLYSSLSTEMKSAAAAASLTQQLT